MLLIRVTSAEMLTLAFTNDSYESTTLPFSKRTAPTSTILSCCEFKPVVSISKAINLFFIKFTRGAS